MRNENSRRSVFTGYVVIPSDVDREEYISIALRTNTVCVQTMFGEFIKNCPVVHSFVGINDGFIHSLDFPSEPKLLGSQVVCLSVPDSRTPLVIGCLAKKNISIDLQEEGQMKLHRVSSTGNYIIEGSALNGIVDILATGENEDGGKVRISSNNKFNTGEIELSSDNITLNAKQVLSALSNNQISMMVRNVLDGDEFSKLVMERVTAVLDAVGVTIGDEFAESITIQNITGQQIRVARNIIEIVGAEDGLVDITAANSKVEISDAGVNIETDDGVWVGGNKNVLYSLSDSATVIQDVSQIGVSTKVKVGI